MAEESKLTEKLEEKESEKKFTEEEMTKVTEFKNTYINIQQALGQLTIAKLRLNQQLENFNKSEVELKDKFIETQKDEASFIEEMTKKYGDGTLNPDTGAFIPNKS